MTPVSPTSADRSPLQLAGAALISTATRPGSGRDHRGLPVTAVRDLDRSTAPPKPAGSAAEGWWHELSVEDREAALRVARCGGFLPIRLSQSLVDAGILILMPDEVRRYLQHQSF